MPNSPYQEQTGLEQLKPADQATSSTQTDPVPSRSRVLSQLPQRYFNALVKPSVATYTADKGDASWSLVWIQLMTWAILDAMLGLLVNLIYPPVTGTTFSRLYFFATSFGLVGLVPLLFFLLMGTVFLCAKVLAVREHFLSNAIVRYIYKHR